MQIAAPDDIEIETLNVPVGDDWRRLPIITRGLGDEWLNSKRTAVDIFVDAFDHMVKRIAQMQNRAMTVTDKV
jgi:hypothetical protein